MTPRLLSADGAILLPSRGRVGRDAMDAVRLYHPSVSYTHAELAYSGGRWAVRDLSSLRGTALNGRPIKAGKAETMVAGDRLRFGEGPEWTFQGDGAPGTFARSLASGAMIEAQEDTLSLPGPGSEEAVLFRDGAGWVMERGATSARVSEGDVVFLAEPWRVHFGVASITMNAAPIWLGEIALVFFRSRSGEQPRVELRHPGGAVDLGHRSHWEVIQVLAEDLLEDAEAPEHDRGWYDLQLLADETGREKDQIDANVSRARAQLVAAGVRDGRSLVDAGRPGYRRLNLHPSQVRIEG